MDDNELKQYVLDQIEAHHYKLEDRLYEADISAEQEKALREGLAVHTEKLVEHIQFNRHLTDLLDNYRNLKFEFEVDANTPETPQGDDKYDAYVCRECTDGELDCACINREEK